jgi:WD40 repeat protein
VAVSGSNAVVETVDPATGEVLRRFHPGGLYIFGVAYSPDDARLATAGWDGNIEIWNTATGRKLGAIPDSDQAVIGSIAWSPDGHTIAIADWQGTLRLYDVASGLELGSPYLLSTPPVQHYPYVTFTSSGSAVVVSDDAGKTWIFPATVTAWERRACAVADREFTRAEWRQDLPGAPYRQVCPAASAA